MLAQVPKPLYSSICAAITRAPFSFASLQTSNTLLLVPSVVSIFSESISNLLKKCKETKQTQKHVCHAGLIDIAIPIIYENSIIGYIILGQIKTEKTFESLKHNFWLLYN